MLSFFVHVWFIHILKFMVLFSQCVIKCICCFLQNEPEHQLQHQQQQHQHLQLLTTADINLFDAQYKLEPGELQFRMPPNFYTQLLTDNQN